MGNPLGIIAGSGALPRLVAAEAAAQGRMVYVVVFADFLPDWAQDYTIIPSVYEKPATLFKKLKAVGCRDIVFAGAMTRPRLNPLRFDAAFLKAAPKLLPALKGGDDATLRAIRQIFEAEGLRILGAHDILGTLLGEEGALTTSHPSQSDLDDIQRGAQIVQALGQVDTGQGAVVANGICLGLESIQGTDAMLQFVADTRAGFADAKGVLFKGQKPTQDGQMDVPAIGPLTIENAAKAGLAGVAYQAGKVMILDREKTIDAANTHGLFIWGQS